MPVTRDPAFFAGAMPAFFKFRVIMRNFATFDLIPRPYGWKRPSFQFRRAPLELDPDLARRATSGQRFFSFLFYGIWWPSKENFPHPGKRLPNSKASPLPPGKNNQPLQQNKTYNPAGHQPGLTTSSCLDRRLPAKLNERCGPFSSQESRLVTSNRASLRFLIREI